MICMICWAGVSVPILKTHYLRQIPKISKIIVQWLCECNRNCQAWILSHTSRCIWTFRETFRRKAAPEVKHTSISANVARILKVLHGFRTTPILCLSSQARRSCAAAHLLSCLPSCDDVLVLFVKVPSSSCIRHHLSSTMICEGTGQSSLPKGDSPSLPFSAEVGMPRKCCILPSGLSTPSDEQVGQNLFFGVLQFVHTTTKMEAKANHGSQVLIQDRLEKASTQRSQILHKTALRWHKVSVCILSIHDYTYVYIYIYMYICITCTNCIYLFSPCCDAVWFGPWGHWLCIRCLRPRLPGVAVW